MVELRKHVQPKYICTKFGFHLGLLIKTVFLSCVRLMQLRILVNNGAVTHTRCLSTKQAPTVLDLLRMIFVFRTGLANGVHFHYHQTVYTQDTNCLRGLTVSPTHLATFCHMLDLKALSVYGFINSAPRQESSKSYHPTGHSRLLI